MQRDETVLCVFLMRGRREKGARGRRDGRGGGGGSGGGVGGIKGCRSRSRQLDHLWRGGASIPAPAPHLRPPLLRSYPSL